MKNKKRILLLTSVLLLALFSFICLAGCDIDNVKEISVTPNVIDIKIGEFNYSDYTVTATYDSGKTVEAVLTEDMLSAKDRISLFLEGEHEITVEFMGKTVTIPVTVSRNVFAGATFDDLDVVYTGEFYTVEVKNVPEGTTVTYPTTNRFKNAGEYTATAVLRKDAYEMVELTSNVIIRKADYDLSEINFENKTVVYDGEQHILEMEGQLPVGLYVDYAITREGGKEENGNRARNAGTYTVTATFSGDTNNYNVVEPKEAVLTIEQALIDMSGVDFSDKTEAYDRSKHELKISGELPFGVSVSYKNNEHVDAGQYEVKAEFSLSDSVNYAPIPDKTATLTITKAEYDMSGVQYNGERVPFDGVEKKIELQGKLPTGVEVSYENNVGLNAGTYQATARFTSIDINYNAPAPLTATLIIDPIAAPIDQIVFERCRFISRGYGSVFYDDDDQPVLDYDYPYQAAIDYVPTNLPSGLDIKYIKYCKTDGWVEDLTGFDLENTELTFSDYILEDGYYVAVAYFEGHGNYLEVSPVRTQIRTTTVGDFETYKLLVFDDEWVDPESGNVTGVFCDYYLDGCIQKNNVIQIDNKEISYCDCNVFDVYRNNGEDALITDDGDLTNYKSQRYQALAEDYRAFISVYAPLFATNPTAYSSSEAGFKKLAATADKATYNSESGISGYVRANPVALIGITDDILLTDSKADKTLSDYRALLAQIFGYDDVEQFIEDAKAVADLLIENDAGASTDSNEARCKYSNAVYEKYESDSVFILPYTFMCSGDDMFLNLNVFLFIDDIDGETKISALVSDIDRGSRASDYYYFADTVFDLYASGESLLETAEFDPDKFKFDELEILGSAYRTLIKSISLSATEKYEYATDNANYINVLASANDSLINRDYESIFYTGAVSFVGLNNDFFVTESKSTKTLSDYRNLIAFVLGYDDVDAFLADAQALVDIYALNAAGASMASVSDQLKYRGCVYEKVEDDSIFIIPYIARWYSDGENNLTVLIFVDNIGGENKMTALISNSDNAFDVFDENIDFIHIYGRCQVAEYERYRIEPIKTVVTINDVDLEKYVTSGKYLSFFEKNDRTDKIVNNERVIFKFRTTLPGNCSEEAEGYDESKYTVIAENSIVVFCDDDSLTSVLKNDGDASGISERENREDRAQMEAEIVAKFDDLSSLYQAFIKNYEYSEDDIVNEWKLGRTNRFYQAYEQFFDFAKEMFSKAGRNMGKNVEYVTSDSAVIGMNRPFAISVNGSAKSYTVEQYRTMVARLFGYDDLDVFTSYANVLATELSKNTLNASADTAASRLIYDGAVYTNSKYFVLPYVINIGYKEKTTVLLFVFVDENGNMSVWVNNARAAIAATDFANLSEESKAWWSGQLCERKVSDKNGIGVTVKYDDSNPFAMIAGDFGEKEEIMAHASSSASETTIASFNALSQAFASFMDNFTVPTDGTKYTPEISGEALDDYTAFYDKAIEIFGASSVSFTKNLNGAIASSAVIGANYPYAMVFGTEIDPESVDLQALAAKLFGFDSKVDFTGYAQELADTYSEHRNNIINSLPLNKALDNGCFYTENGSFVFPIAVKNEFSSVVLVYVIVDSDGLVSVWVNDVDTALFVTNGWGSKLRQRQITDGDKIIVTAKYDDGNPFGVAAGDFGNADNLVVHTEKTVSKFLMESFNALGETFASFMGNFDIPTDDSKYVPEIDDDILERYLDFFSVVAEIYDSSLVSFTKNIYGSYYGSAVIGANYPYAMVFDNDVNLEEVDLQALVARLFGFDSKTDFINCAKTVADTYSAYRTALNNSEPVNKALENGCIYTENGSFVFPIAIKNGLTFSVLTIVIVDTDGFVSVWLNDITVALWATNFDGEHLVGETINNEICGKNMLFVTGPSANDLYGKNILFVTGPKVYIDITGRCMLFEDDGFIMIEDLDEGIINTINYLQGYNPFDTTTDWWQDNDNRQRVIAVEKIKNVIEVGEYLVYSTVSDEEGFDVYLDEVYELSEEVKLQKGFYTMIVVVDLEEVNKANQTIKRAVEAYGRGE